MIKKPSQKPKICVGYIRESTEEQDKGFSPDNQKRTIEEYAKKQNIQIVDWYKDLVSGTKAKK
jgi:DNA invertase Pin-like site-specific DNA recombinase